MGSKIEWTDETWNPVVGCSVASPGCDHCYAATVASRQMQPAHEGLTIGRQWNGTVRPIPARMDDPLRWRKSRRVFVCSMSDLFHPKVTPTFIADVFETMMVAAPQHTYQILTKRPERMRHLLDGGAVAAELADREPAWMAVPNLHNDQYQVCPSSNVWLGTSIESDRYVWRADHLRATPAAVRFLSLEPLLGPLPSLDLTGIDWVIVGGESGRGARPMDVGWVRCIRDRCVDAGVPLFFKQWGEYGISGWRVGETEGPLVKMGKRNAGRELDGRTWDEYPEVAR